ncbi:Protein CBR-JIP-1 [Caenorhabditis briggsae]|uniref:Protein CBR-JIP-1 n=1 Tax=Caenorhabditis briggsae TaxID=6238 RepID=A8X3P2_CAEBR|nr:Protein CBR-JIP-1 [Caenorhabditis briggsae]CAP27252.2 Protein CBR-JIP-1 [Caenorhabditis briggsae]
MSAFECQKCENEENEEEEEEEDQCPTVIRRSYSADWLHNDDSSGADEDSEEDSDAEFLVHPCLRSIIKSKSAYAVPRSRGDDLALAKNSSIKPSKTSFEISLSRMIESTSKSIAQEIEYSVADLLPTLDETWPDPEEDEEETRKKRKKSNVMRYSPSLSSDLSLNLKGKEDDEDEEVKNEHRPCWSSPPNFFDDSFRSVSPLNQKCWSAPDLEDVKFPALEEPPTIPSIPILKELIDESCLGYPVIETPDNDPSVCSYRLPSSLGSAPSPSPPRPLSPVWPERTVASFGWSDGVQRAVHRSATFQINRYLEENTVSPPPVRITVSRSAHSQLYNLGADETEDDAENENDDVANSENMNGGENCSSGVSQLDETEWLVWNFQFQKL